MRYFVCALPLIAAGAALSLYGQSPVIPSPEQRHALTATGTAVVSADADLAVVRANSKVYGPDSKTTSASAADLANTLQHAFASLGLAEGAVAFTSPVLQRTSNYELQEFPMGSEERYRSKFVAMQGWMIRVKPDRAEAVLKAATDSGAAQDVWVQWIVEDPGPFEARAYASALANAREAARQMAQKIGLRLGDLTSVTEHQAPINSSGCCFVSTAYGMGDSVTTTNANFGNGSALVFNSRRVEFKVSVSATYQIEEAPAQSR